MLLLERSALIAAPALETGPFAEELMVVFPCEDLPPALRGYSFCAVRLQGDNLLVSLCAAEAVFQPSWARENEDAEASIDRGIGTLARQVDAVLLRAPAVVQHRLAEAPRFWVCALTMDGQVAQAQCFGASLPGEPALPWAMETPLVLEAHPVASR